jgi:hypothetical protein
MTLQRSSLIFFLASTKPKLIFYKAQIAGLYLPLVVVMDFVLLAEIKI